MWSAAAPDEPDLHDRLHVSTPAGEAWRCLRCSDFVIGQPKMAGPADSAPEVPRGRLRRGLLTVERAAVFDARRSPATAEPDPKVRS